jgi:hypothetical protein
MSDRQCQYCGGPLYGRSDKKYCCATCRRDACRIRTRTIRIGTYEFVGTERRRPDAIEDLLIPKLERQYGPNHRVIRDAKRQAEAIREVELQRLAEAMRRLSWHRQGAQ